MLSLAAALRQLKGFYQLFRCWITGCRKLSKGKQSQRSLYCTRDAYSAHVIIKHASEASSQLTTVVW